MLKVLLVCQKESNEMLKSLLKNSLETVEFIDEEMVDNNCIIIKEIDDNIDGISNLVNYQGLVFMVSDGKYMFELLEYKPLAFIRKDHLQEDIDFIRGQLEYFKQGLESYIDFKSSYQTVRMKINNIVYIESFAHYLIIHSKSANVRVREKLSTTLDKLKPYGFIQVHKSYLVNKHYLKQKNNRELKLENGITIPVGKKFQQVIKDL